MKKIRYFTIFSGVLLFSPQVFAQNFERQNNQQLPFFVPTQETAPRYEKLPPIRNNTQKVVKNRDTLYDVKYVLVEGVYVPTYTKKVISAPVAKQEEKEELTIENHPSIIDNAPAIIQDIEPIAEVVSNENIKEDKETFNKETQTETAKHTRPPLIENNQPYAPPYTNIYAQYIQDTIAFQETGYFPYNKHLETALNKMSSNKKKMIFKGK